MKHMWGALFWFDRKEDAESGRINEMDDRELIEGVVFNGRVLPVAMEVAPNNNRSRLDQVREMLDYYANGGSPETALTQIAAAVRGRHDS